MRSGNFRLRNCPQMELKIEKHLSKNIVNVKNICLDLPIKTFRNIIAIHEIITVHLSIKVNKVVRISLKFNNNF